LSRALAVALILVSTDASAFSIASGFSTGCHERITLDAFEAFLLDVPPQGVPVPDSETWRELAFFFRDAFDLAGTPQDPMEMDDAKRFMFVSLLVGVRSPDTEGHSVLNLSELRRLHSDPSPEGQYAHALRAPADDHAGGNGIAVEGTRQRIAGLLYEAYRAVDPNLDDVEVGEADFYLDFYGKIKVDVWLPHYYVGQAVHAMQDSFSHTIRNDTRDELTHLRQIVHVMNYVDAITYEHDEERDGLAHSDSMDDCTHATVNPGDPDEARWSTRTAARDATIDVFYTARALFEGHEPHPFVPGKTTVVDSLLDKWVTLKDDCDDKFCGNDKWVDVAREKPTKAYAEAIFGCSASPRPIRGAWAICLLALACFLRRRART